LQPQLGSAPRGTPLIWAKSDPPFVDLSVGDIKSQIAAKWLQIAQRSPWRAYRKLPSLFIMVPSLTPYDLPFPQNGGSTCPQHTRMAISLIHFMFGSRVGFSGTADRTALFTIRTNRRWWPPPCWKNFKWRYLRNRSSVPIHFMFCSRMGFSGTADIMALFPVRTNPRWQPPPSWKNFKWPYLHNG